MPAWGVTVVRDLGLGVTGASDNSRKSVAREVLLLPFRRPIFREKRKRVKKVPKDQLVAVEVKKKVR